MEAHARRLLVVELPQGSKAQVILNANRNAQMRDVRAVRRRLRKNGESSRHEDVLGDADSVARPLGDEEISMKLISVSHSGLFSTAA